MKANALEEGLSSPQETTDLLAAPHDENIQESALLLPRKSTAYRGFAVISGLAVFISAVMLCAQIATLAILRGISVEHLLRFYMIAFCVMFILAELRIESFLELLPSFNNWVYRGFLYSFIGVIGGEMSKAMLADIPPKSLGLPERSASLLLTITSYSMVFIGVLYMLMGVCCLHGVWEKIKKGYDEEIDKAIDSPIIVK